MSDEMVEIPPIPAEVFDVVEQMKLEIEMVCGIHPQVIGEPERGARTVAACEQMRLKGWKRGW